MYARYIMSTLSTIIFMTPYSYAVQVDIFGKNKIASKALRHAQTEEDIPLLQTFEALLKVLIAEQGTAISHDLQVCQQKFAKNGKRIPRELTAILPDIYAYIEKLQAKILCEKELTAKTNQSLSEVQSSLLELRSMLLQTVNVVGSSQITNNQNSACLCGCPCEQQLLEIQQSLAALDNQVILLLANLQDLATVVQATAMAVDDNGLVDEAILSNTNTIISQNNQFMNEIFINFAEQMLTDSENLAEIIGLEDSEAQQVLSLDDINHKMLTVLEWLKTISAQLLEVKNLCSACDCIDRYWMNV